MVTHSWKRPPTVALSGRLDFWSHLGKHRYSPIWTSKPYKPSTSLVLWKVRYLLNAFRWVHSRPKMPEGIGAKSRCRWLDPHLGLKKEAFLQLLHALPSSFGLLMFSLKTLGCDLLTFARIKHTGRQKKAIS